MNTVKDLRDFFNNLLNKLSNYDENQCMNVICKFRYRVYENLRKN